MNNMFGNAYFSYQVHLDDGCTNNELADRSGSRVDIVEYYPTTDDYSKSMYLVRLPDGREFEVFPEELEFIQEGGDKMPTSKTPAKNCKFWVVLQTGQNYILDNKYYPNQKDAEQLAERLAQQYKVQYYVLEALSVVGPSAPPIEWTTLEKC